ncbi:MAG: FUSC family protein [Acidobacteriaceae bacterium]|nr:FUSC family protein [Acidobacteriaceae bacterium]MBV9780792.1 FUSC family protein [Acidobacteriaceae bacterium]
MADIPQPRPATAFWRTITKLDRSKINTWIAFRNSLGVALPLGIGIAIGEPLGAVAITTGALNVSYSDGRDPYGQRARRMLTWSILGAVAVFTGSATGKYHWAAIVVAAAWAFVAGMLVSISTRAGDLGLNTLVALIVFAARAAFSAKDAAIAASLVLAGGLLQTCLALLFWPLRRREPERQLLGQLYLDLARDIDPQSGKLTDLPVSTLSPQAQDTLSALGRDHSIEGERYRLLFDQADRIRLSSFILARLGQALRHEKYDDTPDRQKAAECVKELLEITPNLLRRVGDSLGADRPIEGGPDLLKALDVVFEKAHCQTSKADPLLETELPSAVDTLTGQLRSVLELAQHATPEGLSEFAKREAAQPWKLQVTNWFGILRANLHFNSPAFRHAVRLTVCVAIGDAIGRGTSWQRSYWLPMTMAVVLKPDFTTTFSRGILRLAGTFVGLVLATGLYHVFPESALTQLILVGAFTFLLRSIGPANYGVFSVSVSGLIVFLIAATGVTPKEVVTERALNTAAGGILALLAYALWPTWERMQVNESVAAMFDACRIYFRAVLERLEREDPSLEANLDQTRRDLRRARSDAEASVDRVSAEPGIKRERLNCLTSILAHSHALMHAMMALEAGELATEPGNPPPELRAFAYDVEFTLYFLAAALRGSAAASETLPKLREDHSRLMQVRKSFPPAYEFVLIETDRLTTALNTLREQVVRCLAHEVATQPSAQES